MDPGPSGGARDAASAPSARFVEAGGWRPIERVIEEKDEIPREVIDAMAALCLFGLGFREEVGGQGSGSSATASPSEPCLERTRRSGTSSAARRAVRDAIDTATDALRSRYLP